MRFEIHPLQGANSVEFGMVPSQVRKHMGPNFVLFKRGGSLEDDDGKHPSDYYENEGAFFYYDTQGNLEAIEFTDAAEVVVGGINFFDFLMRDAVIALQKIDPATLIQSDGAVSVRLGVALWTPDIWKEEEIKYWEKEDEDWEPDDGRVHSVLIAPASYFTAN